MVYLGSGALKGLAHESALKVLELTAGRVVAMGDSPLAFRHGPKSVLDDRTLVVVYLSNDPYTRAYDLDLLDELRRSRGDEHVLAVTADHGDDVSASDVLAAAGRGRPVGHRAGPAGGAVSPSSRLHCSMASG